MIKAKNRIKNSKGICFLIVLFIFNSINFAFSKEKDEIAEILTKFKNYRFGAVNVYKLQNADEIKQIVQAKAVKKDSKKQQNLSDTSCFSKVSDPRILDLINSGVKNGDDKATIKTNIGNAGYSPPSDEDFECIYSIYFSRNEVGGQKYESSAFLVTTKPTKVGGIPEKVLGLIYNETPEDEIEGKKLKDFMDQATEIYSMDRLMDEKIDQNKYGYKTMYELVINYFKQGNVENKTMEAKAIGDGTIYFTDRVGTSNSLISGDVITPRDIQMFKRISNGEPDAYKGKTNDLVISPDLIRWTSYPLQYEKDKKGKIKLDSLGNQIVDTTNAVNAYLPDFGVELKYGIDEINFSSLWSERVTLSAIWKNVKFGFILPTNGWSSIAKDAFQQERKMTYGGVGIAGKLDFPFVLLPKTDVFQLSFGYVFGDAQKSFRMDDELKTLVPPDYPSVFAARDYLVRGNLQLHYTFGISIDKDYLIRFGVGGTVYNIEAWGHNLTKIVNTNGDTVSTVGYGKYNGDSKTVGGLSGRMEFMTVNNTTPYGITLQYFDESIYVNGWISVPVIENTLSIKLDASGYIVAFRNFNRPWENTSVITPMLRFIYIF